MAKTLFEEVRSEQNIFSAWRHVKRSALTSGNADIRGKASEFEHAHQRHLRRIIGQLRTGKLLFDPVEGVLKDKRKRLSAGKEPRPIAISTIQNRVVQRAILQVLQPRQARDLRDPNTRYETVRDDRLGRINDVNRSKFGVGGLIYPHGGVRPAIETIITAIDGGAKFYFQSDIRAFFTKIPTDKVIDFVRRETCDEAFVELFAKALEVHLGNEDELVGYTHLFPKGGIGVAQGSSLSAFAGNVLLYDMDQTLNTMGVTSVRYIDDILMVSADPSSIDAAKAYAEKTLTDFGFGLYTPADGPEKAAQGECSKSINFLGCTLQPKRCVPSAKSIDNIKEGVRETLASSKTAIKEALTKGTSLNSKHSQSATLESLGKRIYGWQKSFAFCNQRQPFQHLDDYVTKQVADYHGAIVRQLGKADHRVKAMILGVPSTTDMFDSAQDKATKKAD
ncbi:Retron-type reverse transcriptase [Phaeobacter sp. CECT 5382]|uniref:reverse transcriptase domain-containing protein n=1 Tax=Phaeobacter sp. CECT 5382 TaxID=1712645 RepID=UPI0006DADF3F|nr:reverse transcriptase domain-containing protein [Phaeobacter sp. CECT 5382]CUH89848.1 Retron-type reverse transcriptase [Phaeobacter sp. CECT 5382]